MDNYFNDFLIDEGFSPAINTTPVDEDTLQRFQGLVPNRLLSYWEEYGFSGFGQGSFWTTNPQEYQSIIDRWIKNTSLWQRENFFVVARTAFGELYIRGDRSNT